VHSNRTAVILLQVLIG